MTRMKKFVRYGMAWILGIGLLYAAWIGFKVTVNRMVCDTEERLKIDGPSGITFLVEDTACDAIAKDERIRVYAEKTRSEQILFFSRQKTERTLLFSYDPSSYDAPLPSITYPSSSSILISLPEASEIVDQQLEWAGNRILYNIGRVDYPSAK